MPEENMTPETAEPKKKKKKLGKVLYFGLLTIFIGVFVFCAIYITNYMVNSHQVSEGFDSLADRVNSARNDATDPEHTLPTGTGSPGGGENADPSRILPEYQEAYELNNDLVGWIRVPDTTIDYPVLQTPGNPDYYLRRGYDKKYSNWGCIYAREACDVFTPSDNVVLYGHRMSDGTMFAPLDKYRSKSYWEEHQTFSFDTLYERHTYQVIAVFKTSANLGQGFSYHIFNTAESEADFDEFMDTVHSLQFYDTGLTAQYGDMLLTLSTCEYTLNNGRLVVIAKRIS